VGTAPLSDAPSPREPAHGAAAAPAPEEAAMPPEAEAAPRPGRLVARLLALVERRGWRRATLLVVGASVIASQLVTLLVEFAVGVKAADLWLGLVIATLAPLLVATPAIWVTLQLVDHLAGIRSRLQLEIERRARAEARLRRLVTEDDLTGLRNRREFVARARVALALGRRYRHSVAILLIDLDRFKEVNDRFGHQAGDRALVRVARVLRHELRESDTAARIGGDELVALLPQTGIAAAAQVAERIRRAVAGDPGEPPVTVTIGCAAASGPRSQLGRLLRAADQALYAAKAAGRNQVFVARRDGEPAPAGAGSP
jgi:diguanylate cyclase (GGDEF)-like protein